MIVELENTRKLNRPSERENQKRRMSVQIQTIVTTSRIESPIFPQRHEVVCRAERLKSPKKAMKFGFSSLILAVMASRSTLAWISPCSPRKRKSSLPQWPIGLELSSATDDFANFAASLEEDEAAAAPSKTTDATTPSPRSAEKDQRSTTTKNKTWQEDLEELLDPLTTLARRQILLSDLMAENADIQASVQAAIRDRKVR